MIETASIASYALPESAAKAKLRNAPPMVKARVDATRRERGLSPLFAKAATTRLAPVAVMPEPPKVARTLCGVAAPGISQPCTIRTDSRTCREEIAASAWMDVAADVRAGRHFAITDGHGGRVIATSADPRLRWKIDPKVGLMFELDLRKANELTWPGPLDCSIGMKPLAFTHRYSDVGWVRRITSMRLEHIALLRPSQRMHGCYPLATVQPAKSGEAGKVGARLWLDTFMRVGK
jgi:hypothetical protein